MGDPTSAPPEIAPAVPTSAAATGDASTPRRARGGRGVVALLLRPAVVAVVALVIAAVVPFLGLSAFWLSTLVFILIGAIGALGLNVLSGYAGQVSLGHAFFLGIGAYTAAVLGLDHGVGAWLWIPAAGVVAALFGAVVGPTALRLRGLYLAIVTIGLVFIGGHFFATVTSVSGGTQGRGVPAPRLLGANFGGDDSVILGLGFDRNALYYFLALILLAAGMLFVHNLTRTRTGRALQAVRDRESAASLMGIDLARTKVTAFIISSFLAGICGALYGSYLTHVDPDQWGLLLSIQFVAIIIVGGIGTLWGAVLGSIVVQGISPVLTNYSDSIPFLQHTAGGGGISVGDASNIAYGVLIVAFLVVAPRGVAGLFSTLRARILRWCEASSMSRPTLEKETT